MSEPTEESESAPALAKVPAVPFIVLSCCAVGIGNLLGLNVADPNLYGFLLLITSILMLVSWLKIGGPKRRVRQDFLSVMAIMLIMACFISWVRIGNDKLEAQAEYEKQIQREHHAHLEATALRADSKRKYGNGILINTVDHLGNKATFYSWERDCHYEADYGWIDGTYTLIQGSEHLLRATKVYDFEDRSIYIVRCPDEPLLEIDINYGS